MIMPELMIEAQDLRRNFSSKEAVAGISFTTRRGEILACLVLTVLAKPRPFACLPGRSIPAAVALSLPVVTWSRSARGLKERIGVVFEEQNLYERLSARLNLQFSCWLYGLPESRVDEVLDLVRLRDRAKDKVRTFSNGMRQRLMIARALLHCPPLLFLDEPSRGLDPISAREVRQTIKQLSDAGTTILLTTHLMDEADQLCQRVAFIVNGRLVANDTPRNLKLAHGQRALLVTLAGDPGSQNGNSALCEMTLSLDDPADQQRLATWMTQDKVRAIHSREATLEEVFIEVAGVRPA